MSEFEVPVAGTRVILEVYFPELPVEWQTIAGPMHLADMREWEVKVIAEEMAKSLLTQWRILNESPEKRAARRAKARLTKQSHVGEQDRARLGVDDHLMNMIDGVEKRAVNVTEKAKTMGNGTIAAIEEMVEGAALAAE